MPLEDEIKRLTAAVEDNTKALMGIKDAASARRSDSGDPPAPSTGRRGRPPAVPDKTPAATPTPEPRDLTVPSMKKFVTEWLQAGDGNDQAAADERDDRKAFLVRVCKYLKVERITECEPELRAPVMALFKTWIDDPKVNIERALEAPAADGGNYV